MSTLFQYVPHPHIEHRKAAGPPKVAAALAQVHGPGPIGRLNAKVGLKVTLKRTGFHGGSVYMERAPTLGLVSR